MEVFLRVVGRLVAVEVVRVGKESVNSNEYSVNRRIFSCVVDL